MWAGLEFLIPVLVASASGIFAVHAKLSTRIENTGNRLDQLELRLAEKYVPRHELTDSMKDVMNHMLRIEDKLDKIVLHGVEVEKKFLAAFPPMLRRGD